MDFREGGTWHYSMIGPENQVHYCRFDYELIRPERSYTGLDAFCDEAGNINTDFSRMHWHNEFKDAGERTTVHVTIKIDTLETLEKIIAMGFKEGFSLGLDQLDTLLATLKN